MPKVELNLEDDELKELLLGDEHKGNQPPDKQAARQWRGFQEVPSQFSRYAICPGFLSLCPSFCPYVQLSDSRLPRILTSLVVRMSRFSDNPLCPIFGTYGQFESGQFCPVSGATITVPFFGQPFLKLYLPTHRVWLKSFCDQVPKF